MSIKTIPFLKAAIPLPFQFSTMLPFSEADKNNFPWLNDPFRYYMVERELKKGGRSIALLGYVSDSLGNRLPDTPTIVIKIPNVDLEKFNSKEIKEYLGQQIDECGREWNIARARLDTKYANPILDFHTHALYYINELMQLPVTVQLFLDQAYSLDDYLLKKGQRTKPYAGRQRGANGGPPDTSNDNWRGMPDPRKWLELCRCIAIGLADIHQRRVVHGDIWPPNIFIKEDETGKPFPVFIDFGEAFPLEPKGESREIRNHAYRAPERSDAQNIVTQKSDVYSFGKLMLHLAIGIEPILTRNESDYDRRQIIRAMFLQNNEGIISENPFIIDIICKCISLDSLDRPGMDDVLRALNSYVDLETYSTPKFNVSEGLSSLQRSWRLINARLNTRNESVAPFLEELLGQRISDIERLMKGLADDVIILTETRERLILALITLFQRLGKGDRFISITSPQLWRSSALGLDGRYFTASELATVREASIQRTFIFSIEEVGEKWARRLAENLEVLAMEKPEPRAKKMAEALYSGISAYVVERNKNGDYHPDLRRDARNQLTLVIKSYLTASTGICKGMFDNSPQFESSEKCKGIYLGLKPLSTISKVATLKSSQPIGVFYYNQEKEERDRYLLMMTDCHARNAFASGSGSASRAFPLPRPELRGIIVYKSFLGVPDDRIKMMEREFRQSVNIGPWVAEFCKNLPDVNYELIDNEALS